jgi:hypothetical protein
MSESNEQYSAEEAAQRRDAVIRHMLSKPPEPRQSKKKGDDRKPQSPPR